MNTIAPRRLGLVSGGPLPPPGPTAPRRQGAASLTEPAAGGEGPPGRLTPHAMGAAGEAAAVRFLQAKGLVILDRNWRGQGGELDIVAFAEPSIVAVVEVKTRSGSGFGDPAVAVTGLKYSRLRRLAGQWVASHDVPAQEIRIDIVGVMMSRDGRLRAIDHIEGAFS